MAKRGMLEASSTAATHTIRKQQEPLDVASESAPPIDPQMSTPAEPKTGTATTLRCAHSILFVDYFSQQSTEQHKREPVFPRVCRHLRPARHADSSWKLGRVTVAPSGEGPKSDKIPISSNPQRRELAAAAEVENRPVPSTRQRHERQRADRPPAPSETLGPARPQPFLRRQSARKLPIVRRALNHANPSSPAIKSAWQQCHREAYQVAGVIRVWRLACAGCGLHSPHADFPPTMHSSMGLMAS